ncbi:MAG: lipid II flippase MurJ [Terracidiphilus sp.]
MPGSPPTQPPPAPRSRWARALGVLRPSRSHSTFSASMLLGTSSLVSSLIGLARGKFVAWIFGAGHQTDAFNAAFRLPDLMNNFLVGGAVSITFVTLLNRYREQGDEDEGERLLFTVVNLMALVLVAASVVLVFLAAPFIRATNPGFTPAQVALSAHMTWILLPAQIFLFVGSAVGSTLLVRRQFLFQAAQPILYNLFIIGSGYLLHRQLGIFSLAVGSTCGFLFGSLATNAWGAWRAGVQFRFGIDFHHPGLRLWLRMSLPLMLGFGLPFLDQYFWGYFASRGVGDITRLTNARQLFSAPMSMLAQAAGVASMPFFAALWAKRKHYEFALDIADTVSRIVSLALLAASGMIALAQPIVGLAFGGGRFGPHDVQLTALYFACFTVSLCFWSAQSVYARAFYAAGITWLPMLASTLIVVAALPLYGIGYRLAGAVGLALASDSGIALQAIVLALLLHKRHMVSLASLDYAEIGRCLLAGLVSGSPVWLVFGWFGGTIRHWLRIDLRWADLVLLLAGAAIWTALVLWILERTGSALPRVLRKRLGLRSAL